MVGRPPPPPPPPNLAGGRENGRKLFAAGSKFSSPPAVRGGEAGRGGAPSGAVRCLSTNPGSRPNAVAVSYFRTFALSHSGTTMQTVQTDNAPAAIGPYSQAIVANGFVFTAGQVPFDPASMQLVEGDIAAQTEQVMKNVAAILRQAGADLSTVVKTTVFLRDMNDFAAMNEVYARHFGEHKPARSTVQVARLPRDVAVEIEAVAVLLDR